MRRTLQPEGPIAKWNPSSFLYSRAASAPRCGATPGGSSRSARFSILGAFVVYATWAAFQGNHYAYGPYLSPFYSPVLFGEGPHSWFGPKPGWWPALAAVLAGAADLCAFPAVFRFTCYYYRGAYYKAFWADPPSCAVGEPRKSYRGENSFPLDPAERPPLLPVPRAALPVRPRATTCGRRCGSPIRRPARTTFGIGVGTLVLAVNVVLLSGYTLGCHSLRHLVGGCLDRALAARRCGDGCYDCVELPQPPAHAAGRGAACSRSRFADLYVRLCSMGVWTDWRIF